MANEEDADRAPVTCLECGKIMSARVDSDGSIHPIGRTDVCDCEDPDVQVMEEDTSIESGIGDREASQE